MQSLKSIRHAELCVLVQITARQAAKLKKKSRYRKKYIITILYLKSLFLLSYAYTISRQFAYGGTNTCKIVNEETSKDRLF
jgi:hypothetical protein